MLSLVAFDFEHGGVAGVGAGTVKGFVSSWFRFLFLGGGVAAAAAVAFFLFRRLSLFFRKLCTCIAT